MKPLELLRILEYDGLVVERITYEDPGPDRITVVFKRLYPLVHAFVPPAVDLARRKAIEKTVKNEIESPLKNIRMAEDGEPLVSPESLERISRELEPEADRIRKRAEEKLRELENDLGRDEISLSCPVDGCSFKSPTVRGIQIHKARAHKKVLDNEG